MSKVADSVSFDVEGERKTLRLTPGAWIELEDAGLGNVKELGQALEAKPSFKTFVKVFAAALRGGTDRQISDDTALELADKIGSERTITLVGKVVTAAFPEMAKDSEGNAPTAQTGKMPD